MTDPKTPEQRRKEAQEAALTLAALRATASAVRAAFLVSTLPLRAWLLMLVLGAVHTVAAPVAAASYGTAVLLTLGVDLLAVTTKRFRR